MSAAALENPWWTGMLAALSEGHCPRHHQRLQAGQVIWFDHKVSAGWCDECGQAWWTDGKTTVNCSRTFQAMEA